MQKKKKLREEKVSLIVVFVYLIRCAVLKRIGRQFILLSAVHWYQWSVQAFMYYIYINVSHDYMTKSRYRN